MGEVTIYICAICGLRAEGKAAKETMFPRRGCSSQEMILKKIPAVRVAVRFYGYDKDNFIEDALVCETCCEKVNTELGKILEKKSDVSEG